MKKLIYLLMAALILAACDEGSLGDSAQVNESEEAEKEQLKQEKREQKEQEKQEKLQEKERLKQEKQEEKERKAQEKAEEKERKALEKAEAKELKEKEKAETAQEEKEEVEETNWDEFKGQGVLSGKSDKDFKDLTKSKPGKVRGDSTDKWKKVTISESVNIEEYLLSYADRHMKEEGTHFIINFNLDTTTTVNKIGDIIYADIHEYIDKEEHDASVLGSGMLLSSYVIYPDGDVEEMQ